MNIDIPFTKVLAYLEPTYRFSSPLTRADAARLPARPDPACDYYIILDPFDLYTIDLDQPDPLEPGTIRSVGKFPSTRVSALAFGVLPISAMLTVEQVRRDGKVVPIQLDDNQGGRSFPEGTTPSFTAPNGCDAAWERDLPHTTVVTGRLQVRLSDVQLDSRPLDVGNDCHVATPLQLHLNGVPRKYGSDYDDPVAPGVLVQQKDSRVTAGSNPIAISPYSANLTVPPFTNCIGASGVDYSKVISGLVSGPDATLAVNKSNISFGLFDPVTNPALSTVPVPPFVNPPPPGR